MTDPDIKALFKYDTYENRIFMPNEIFDDLAALKEKGSSHITFTYSYYYLINWLYRYAKYGKLVIDVKMIKEVLGYSKTNKTVDYIMKKGGVLDSLRYTETTPDYPIEYEFQSDTESLHFTLISEMDNLMQKQYKQRHTNRYTIKYPIKSFNRSIESEEDNYMDGTYFQLDNTHEVPFEVFVFCMNNEEIGCTGFYLWSYLKMMNQLFENGFDCSLDKLSESTSIIRKTLCKYLDVLKQHNMISTKHNQEYFSIQIKKEDRKANTYFINSVDQFSVNKMDYHKMEYKTSTNDGEIIDFDDLFL